MGLDIVAALSMSAALTFGETKELADPPEAELEELTRIHEVRGLTRKPAEQVWAESRSRKAPRSPRMAMD